MHRFVKGMPEFTIPNAFEEFPICLTAKLRKQSSGTESTMRSIVCNQGISIDFGFMVQRQQKVPTHFDRYEWRNMLRFDNQPFQWSICMAVLSLPRLPPVKWINNWLANNSPTCPNKYVWMDGGDELGKGRAIHQTFMNVGFTVKLTGPNSLNQNGPEERPHQTIYDVLRAMLSGANLQPNLWLYAFYHYGRLYNFVHHGI